MNRRCPDCGRFVKEELPHSESFKATFSPRQHGHGASNHGPEKELNEISRRAARGGSA